ncbi:MAG: inositol-3-phosphate synthase [Candidatus Aenigmarchaeota archaeon]|nr:inositol-3-phosphate synthase [Candidatus Aenigmarchaeota archaeon]
MKEIKVAIAGVGNCASSLIQGLFYYKDVASNDDLVPGLMHNVIGGYKISDLKPVAAFDIDRRKVGKDLSEAILAKPNNTIIFQKDIPNLGVEVKKGPVLDGVASHMGDYDENRSFRVSDGAAINVAKELKNSGAEVLINYMPVGSQQATEYYANACLEAGVGLVNCMPVFIASNPEWEKKFKDKGLPIVGDDIKAQIGATITHRTLAKLFSDRGVKVERTYQLNVGGNTDFLNMKEGEERLKSKRESKSSSVQSQLPVPLAPENIHIGPSDHVPWLNDKKLCFLRLEGRKFGDVPISLELRLDVEDSPNSAGCSIDGIRCCKLGMDRGLSGELTSISSYTMKHPMTQFPDTVAREMLEEFIKGERER